MTEVYVKLTNLYVITTNVGSPQQNLCDSNLMCEMFISKFPANLTTIVIIITFICQKKLNFFQSQLSKLIAKIAKYNCQIVLNFYLNY